MRTQGIALADNGHISVAPTELVDESRFGNDGVFGAGAKAPTMAQLPSGLWVYGMTTADDTHIEIVDSDSLDIIDAITLEIWINPTIINTFQRLIHKNGSFSLTIDNAGSQIIFINYDGPYTSTSNADVLTASVWKHVIITKTTAVGVTFFVNGIAEGTDGAAAAKADFPVTANALYIGIDEDETTFAFGGRMTLPHIYNYALNPAQIRSRFNETRGFFNV